MPVPETLIVCSGVVVVGSTAAAGRRGFRAGIEVATRNRLTPIPAAISLARGPGVGIVRVVDISDVLLSDCRRCWPV